MSLFKVGDKVRVVRQSKHSSYTLSEYDFNRLHLGRKGEVINVRDHLYYKYEVGFGFKTACYSEDELELINTPTDRQKVKSDGGSTEYYKLPDHATELRHLISYKGMSKSRGDIFKACYRLGEKEGVDVMYELNKMEFFIKDLKEMYERGELI